MIRAEINSEGAQKMLLDLDGRLQKPRALLEDIGEYMVRATKRRFKAGKDPDGTPWRPNTPATILAYLFRRGGGSSRRKGEKSSSPYYTKKGLLNSRGSGLVMGKRPLIGEGKRLMDEFSVQVSAIGVTIASNQRQSRVMQKGAKKGSLGPNAPWGDIPARQFLGFSREDRVNVADMVREYLTGRGIR